MGRWFVLFALPLLVCSLLFEALLVIDEDLRINFFVGGYPFGAPFLVGVGRVITAIGEPKQPGQFSIPWFALDVLVTAAIAALIAWSLRIRNAWPPAVASTVVGLFMVGYGPRPIPFRSYGFSLWIYWLVAFALMAAIWTGVELYRARPRRT